MQRVSVSAASPLSLQQALTPAATSVLATAQSVAPAEPAAPTRPTLAEERERVLAQAHQEGLRKGEQEALAQYEQRLAAARKELDAAHAERTQALEAQQALLGELIAGLPGALDAVRERTLEDAAVLALEVATRLYGQAEGIDFASLCTQLLHEHPDHPVTLRVAPSQVAAVTSLAGAQVRVMAGAGLSPGQVQLQTATGTVDGGLDVRLDAIRSAFLAGMSRVPA